MDASTETMRWIGEHAATLAYTGAGADLGLISAAIGLVLTLGSSLFFLVFWPVRMAIRKLRNRIWQRTPDAAEDDAGSENESPGEGRKAA